MIFWRGLGFLVVLFGGGAAAVGSGIGSAMGATGDTNLGTGLGFLVGGAVTWYIGRRLNRPVAGYHRVTGEPTTYRNRHTFMFVPMQY